MAHTDPQGSLDLQGGNISEQAVNLAMLSSEQLAQDGVLINGDKGPNELAGLHKTFELFGQMSQQLSQSYLMLEDRVKNLSSQLEEQTAERIRELTEKQKLADRLSSLLDILPGGVVVIDGDGIVQQCNPVAEELLKSFGGTLVGSRWVDIIRVSFKPRRDDGHEASTADGLRLSISTRSMDSQPGQIVLLTDQTETRRLQEEVSRNERLSAMGKMVASLAHQIRTPLSAAMLFGGHLSAPELEDAKRIEIAKKMMSRLAHLEQQVRDMLIFAKGDIRTAQIVRIKEFCLSLQDAVYANNWPDHVSIEIQNQCPEEEMCCNVEALVGAVFNLVDNAVQATSDNISIKIQLTHSDDKKLFLCSVEDNGPGIDQARIQKIMEPFYTTKSQGTGLGLAVVNAVVTAHGGDFSIHSESGKGTQALMVIPFANSTSTKIEGSK
jgi:two-component system sensor histidine kinase FlrB